MVQKIKNKSILYFTIPYFTVLSIVTFMIITNSKAELHLTMNEYHTPFLDIVFKNITHLGGATITISIIIALLFYRFSVALFVALSELLGFILTYYGKLMFAELRPFFFFQEYFPNISLPLVDGAYMYQNYSFPSGHTVTAFIMFLGLALVFNKKWISILSITLAILVAYSRIYLSQHFAIDTLIGSTIGVLCAWLFYPLYLELDNKWRDKSILTIFKKN